MGQKKISYQSSSRDMAEPFPLLISKFKVKISWKGDVTIFSSIVECRYLKSQKTWEGYEGDK